MSTVTTTEIKPASPPPVETIKVKVDGKEIVVPKTTPDPISGKPVATTMIQACALAKVDVPHYCYHPKLPVAGNCRMCLVEFGTPGMEIYTATPGVKQMREGVLEFLLINHPLDCPICDQAGECKLQEYSVDYGQATSRFVEP